MSIRSILAVTDLSEREDMAVRRAAQLAHTHRASVKLMVVPPRGQPMPPAATSRLANAARQLEESLGLRVRTAPVQAGKLEYLIAQARGMDLVVLPHRHERSTAAFFRGQPVLRLLRCCSCPVLVVRQARGVHYERALVAVDFSALSEGLVKMAASFDPPAELQVFHAISTLDETKLRSAEATEHAVRAYRDQCLKHAQQRVVLLTDSLAARSKRVVPVFGHGDPGQQAILQQQRCGADLVVLGKKRSTAWEDFLCGSVAHHVLSWASSDVLVVPEGHLQATAPIAARRMARRGGQPARPVRPLERRPS
jgi:nucleotide-binding universal stress UspA family protein